MTAAELAQLAHDIKLWARELGFDQVGIADTDLTLEEPRLQAWLDAYFAPLEPLRRLDVASREADSGPELRALLIRLVDGGGMVARAGSGLDGLDKAQRDKLRKLGVRIGALDLFAPAMLRPAPSFNLR